MGATRGKRDTSLLVRISVKRRSVGASGTGKLLVRKGRLCGLCHGIGYSVSSYSRRPMSCSIYAREVLLCHEVSGLRESSRPVCGVLVKSVCQVWSVM